MTRKEILSMARQAGSMIELAREKDLQWLERFATLVAEREREACAKVCEQIDSEYDGEEVLATWCASAIRARSTK